MKQIIKTAEILALALSYIAVLAGCGGVINNDDALYELAGRWYGNNYDFAFEITQAGEGYIAESKTQCAVSVSGSFVSFRDSRDYLLGSFSYFIKNGELTMTYGRGDFNNMESLSPFIKFGAIPSGGKVPVELIGAWYSESHSTSVPNFEIAASGIMTISGTAAQYTAIVQGNTISVLDSSVLRGTFRYTFIYEAMIISNGTDICEGLVILSPFVKKNS
jgi:hypothetical protein